MEFVKIFCIYIMLLSLLHILFLGLDKKRARDHVINLKNEKEGVEKFSVLNRTKSQGWFYFFCKNLFLADFFHFKNSARTHFQLIRAGLITLNIFFFGYFLAKLLPILSDDWFFEVQKLKPKQVAYFGIVTTLSIYWNLIQNMNKKFDYCLNTYNQIYLQNNSHLSFLEVTLAMDILTMDLWSKRILRAFFSRVLHDAFKWKNSTDYFPKSCCNLISEEEAYNLLYEYASHVKV